MAVEDRANRAFQWRQPGYYVINQRTNLAVSGPHPDQYAADAEKAMRDARWPGTPDVLRVLVVAPGSASLASPNKRKDADA
jgi:hypothetical protein